MRIRRVAQPGALPIGVSAGHALAEGVAGCIAMSGGSCLASEAEEALYAAKIADEGREIDDHPGREVAELALVLKDERLDRGAAERVASGLAMWSYIILPLTAPADHEHDLSTKRPMR